MHVYIYIYTTIISVVAVGVQENPRPGLWTRVGNRIRSLLQRPISRAGKG